MSSCLQYLLRSAPRVVGAMRGSTRSLLMALLLAAGAGLSATNAHAAISVFWSAGATCSGSTNAIYIPGGANVEASLCVTATVSASEQLCGHSVRLKAASAAEDGRFQVAGRTLATEFSYANSLVNTYPVNINATPVARDFGGTFGTVFPIFALPAGSPQLLATFQFAPQATATNASYVIATDSASMLSVDTDGSCGTTADFVMPTASFTLVKQSTTPPPPTPTLITAVASLSSDASLAPRYGTPVSLVANVTGTNPTGTLRFVMGTDSNSATVEGCASVPLVNGTARCALPRLARPAGNNIYTAMYGGDANHTAATSSLTLAIAQADVVLTISAAPVKPVAGQSVTLSAFLGADDVTGQVSFSRNGEPIAGCTGSAVLALPAAADPDAGVAGCTLNSVAAGASTIRAIYSGTSNNNAASATLALTVAESGVPIDYSDMWWNGTAENGWGLSIAQKGSVQFNAIYVYDASGRPTWYVMPGGSWDATTGADAWKTYRGPIYQPTGAPFDRYDTSAFVPGSSVGNAVIRFLDAGTAEFTITVNGVTNVKRIVRQGFGTTDSRPRMIVNDLWWAGVGENGWGINIAQQARTLFMVWYTYGADGKPTWFTVPGGTWNGTIFTGDIYNTTGSAWLGVPYDATLFRVNRAGTMVIDFEDADRAVMTYTINGVTQVKRIVRQAF